MTSNDRAERVVREYVEGRMHSHLPLDLVSSIQRNVDRTQQRRRPAIGWAVLASVGATAAAAALLAALLITGRPVDDIGSSPTPEPTSTEIASPSDQPSPSVTPSPTVEATPDDTFGPAHSMDPADAFTDPKDCENPAGGYRISMPEAWYYNTEFDGFDACQWFAPTTYPVTDGSSIPNEVAIVLSVQDGGDFGPGGEIVSQDAYTVASRPAMRYEVAGEPGGVAPERSVVWIIGLDGELPSESTTGAWLLARTGTDRAGDLDENIDVLDRMIATLALD